MTNTEKKKRRELLNKASWTNSDIMAYFGYSKGKATSLLTEMRKDDNAIPLAFRGKKRPPILTDYVLEYLGTTKDLEINKIK